MGDTIFEYQLSGVEFLVSRARAYLADEMGLGKTAQAVLAAARIRRRPHVLVVCPAVARPNWLREWVRWFPHDGNPAPPNLLSRLGDRAGHVGVWVCSHDYARANGPHLFSRGPWDALILDEAHAYRNGDALRTKAMFGSPGVARSARRVWWLSGTPLEYHPGELWLPMYFSGATILARAAWVERFCRTVPGGHGGVRILGAKPSAIGELRELIDASGFFLRRTKNGVGLQLPPLLISEVAVDAGLLPEGSWDALTDGVRLDAERELLRHALSGTSGLTLDRLEELRGFAKSVSTLLRYNGLCKVGSAVALAQEAFEGGCPKLVVFAVHRQVIAALAERLRDYHPAVITGDTPPTERQQAVDDFQAEGGECRVLVGQLRAAGTAITLHASDTCLVVEHEWDPASLAQAIARLHRVGQTRPVTARVLYLDNDGLDGAIGKIVARRASEVQSLWGAK